MPQTKPSLFIEPSGLEALSLAVGGLALATYSFPAADRDAAVKMAVQIASGQTVGYVPDPLEPYLPFMARILAIASDAGRARAEIAFPGHLFGRDCAGLLTVLFGKISFAPGLKLESLKADTRFLGGLSGAKFGLEGIRQKAGLKAQRPLLMAILKPGLGVDDKKLADQFGEFVRAGVDLVKDDEVRVDLTIEAAKRRLSLVLEAGKGRGLYVVALNGPAFELRDRALILQKLGAQAFLVCPYTYGVSVLQSLCQDPEIRVPIFAHPAFTGIMSSETHGIHPAVSLGTLMRWCGADAVLFPSPYGLIALKKEEAVSVHHELIRDDVHLLKAASVPSAGIMPRFVPEICRDFGLEVVVNAGTGMARSGESVGEGARLFLEEIERSYGRDG